MNLSFNYMYLLWTPRFVIPERRCCWTTLSRLPSRRSSLLSVRLALTNDSKGKSYTLMAIPLILPEGNSAAPLPPWRVFEEISVTLSWLQHSPSGLGITTDRPCNTTQHALLEECDSLHPYYLYPSLILKFPVRQLLRYATFLHPGLLYVSGHFTDPWSADLDIHSANHFSPAHSYHVVYDATGPPQNLTERHHTLRLLGTSLNQVRSSYTSAAMKVLNGFFHYQRPLLFLHQFHFIATFHEAQRHTRSTLNISPPTAQHNEQSDALALQCGRPICTAEYRTSWWHARL